MSKRRAPQEEARIVPEFLNAGTSAAGSCCKRGASPAMFQNWTDQFMESGKQVLGIRQVFIWKHTSEQNWYMESFHGTLKWEHVWPDEFVKFQDAEAVLVRVFADCNDYRIHLARGHVHAPPTSLSAKRRMGRSEERNHAKKDAKNGTKTREPDQYYANSRCSDCYVRYPTKPICCGACS